MDRTEKLFRKIPPQDLKRIRVAIELLITGELQGVQLKNEKRFRYRVGDYRIFYVIENGKIIIDMVRRRNERTYK